jgi:hypothetical protein
LEITLENLLKTMDENFVLVHKILDNKELSLDDDYNKINYGTRFK